jgi:hypothetical protein
MLSIVLGLTVWIWMEILNPEGTVPPQLAGLIASFGGMIAGSLVGGPLPREAHAGSQAR